MPSQHKRVICPHCQREMRSNNLKKHLERRHRVATEIIHEVAEVATEIIHEVPEVATEADIELPVFEELIRKYPSTKIFALHPDGWWLHMGLSQGVIDILPMDGIKLPKIKPTTKRIYMGLRSDKWYKYKHTDSGVTEVRYLTTKDIHRKE